MGSLILHGNSVNSLIKRLKRGTQADSMAEVSRQALERALPSEQSST